MKTYQLKGKSYTENEVIAIHAMWQGIQDRDNIKECMEAALVMIDDDAVSDYVRNNESNITEQSK